MAVQSSVPFSLLRPMATTKGNMWTKSHVIWKKNHVTESQESRIIPAIQYTQMTRTNHGKLVRVVRARIIIRNRKDI